jgi:hypothetical protein
MASYLLLDSPVALVEFSAIYLLASTLYDPPIKVKIKKLY